MKMNILIAFLTNAPVIFLDHPTKFADPVSRHGIYTLLEYIQKSGRAIIMISDRYISILLLNCCILCNLYFRSMYDCDLLCTRMAILSEGQFKCIGSIQDLKERFGLGYTVIVKTRAMNNRLFNM